MISVTKPVVSVLVEPVYPEEDATSVNQVISASLSVPDAIATVMLMYVIKILVSVYTVPGSLLEIIAKCKYCCSIYVELPTRILRDILIILRIGEDSDLL